MRTGYQRIIILSLLTIIYSFTFAQAPSINWQHSYGSVQSDNAARVQNAANGHLIVTSVESREDPTGVYYYYLAVRNTDQFGRIVWERFFNPMAINNLPNSSNVFDFTPQWVHVGAAGDMVIDISITPQGMPFHDLLHLDSTGAFLDHNTFIASLTARPSDNETYTVRINGNPNLVAGYSHDSLHLTMYRHYLDIDTPVWETSFEQTLLVSVDPDIFWTYMPGDIIRDADGNILLIAILQTDLLQHCTDCGPTGLYNDIVLYKFDSTGHLLLSKDLLHNSETVIEPHIIQSEMNGSYWITWRDWQQYQPHGNTRIIELDHNANILSNHPTGWHYSKVIQNATADGFYALGSADEDSVFPGLHGQNDAVVAAFDIDGAELWRAPYGGSDFEFARDIITTADGGLLFFSDATSADGDVASPQGSTDAWLVKLGGVPSGLHDAKQEALTVYPNPSHGTLQVTAHEPITHTTITDIAGQAVSDVVYSGAADHITLRTSGIATGSYVLTVTTTTGVQRAYRITVM
ncbi:MAG: C-terminal target protein [Bacteroidetes bacterium]|nr:C-terminal target protein [Bacteroidota bacterium]